MKIAMVSANMSPLGAPGGQSVHVAELSAALARRGHAVTVYTRRDNPDSPDRVRTPQGYNVVHVPAGPPEPLPGDELLESGLNRVMGTFAGYLAMTWRARRPDIAHAHCWMSGVSTHLAARTCGLPTVQTFHGLGVVEERHRGDPGADMESRQKLERLIARNASWVAATCTEEVFELTRMGRTRTRISLLPSGVDPDRFNPEGPVAERGAAHRIVSVGRMLPRNGFDTVIEAMPSIADAELVIVGGPDAEHRDSDPEIGRLRARAAELGIGDRVSFTGSVARADMPALLRSADVVACTPWYEPSGMVPLEAMGCGAPVVASAVGGMLDTVVHDVTGRLVTPRRPRECAEALSTVLRDSFLRRSLGSAGRDRVCARYSWDRVAADALRIYERLVSTPTSLAPPIRRSS